MDDPFHEDVIHALNFFESNAQTSFSEFWDHSIIILLKTVAFIAGKKNPADQNFYICFSIEIKLKK